MKTKQLHEFANKVAQECQQRDPTAKVSLHQTQLTPMTGEYMLEINYNGGRDLYAFNPDRGEWIIVYGEV